MDTIVNITTGRADDMQAAVVAGFQGLNPLLLKMKGEGLTAAQDQALQAEKAAKE